MTLPAEVAAARGATPRRREIDIDVHLEERAGAAATVGVAATTAGDTGESRHPRNLDQRAHALLKADAGRMTSTNATDITNRNAAAIRIIAHIVNAMTGATTSNEDLGDTALSPTKTNATTMTLTIGTDSSAVIDTAVDIDQS